MSLKCTNSPTHSYINTGYVTPNLTSVISHTTSNITQHIDEQFDFNLIFKKWNQCFHRQQRGITFSTINIHVQQTVFTDFNSYLNTLHTLPVQHRDIGLKQYDAVYQSNYI